jgi:AIPR protein
MAEESELLIFLEEIESDITADVQPSGGNPADFREMAFSRMLAEDLDAAGVLEAPVICHCEHGRATGSFKVSGYSVPEEDNRLDLLVTVYQPGPHQEIPTLNAGDVDTSFNKVERFLSRALDGLHDELEPSLPERYMAERIHQLKGSFDRVNFLLLTNSKLAVRREKKRKDKIHGVLATYEIWDLERFRRLRESGAGYESLSVDLRALPKGGLPCVRLDQAEKGYHTCLAIFPGTLLRDLYDEHGSRLLELNVRSYLQAKGKINKGIMETLKHAPVDFMAYNNGITVVAEKMVFGDLTDGREGIVQIEGMQIVNGGQTTASIHRASKEFDAKLSEVHVQAKIVTIEPSRFNEVVPFISRYANSQNKVTEPDLQSNHPFHVGLERVARREWTPDQTSKWFYERARGSYQTARTREGNTEARRREFDKKFPAKQRFTKEDLARFENSWGGLPYVVNRGQQKNFTHFMSQLKSTMGDLSDNWEPTPDAFRRLIGNAILFRTVHSIVKADEEITAYPINITNYTVSLIAEHTARRIDLDAVWKQQSLSPKLADLAKSWAKTVFAELLKYIKKNPGQHIDTVLKSQATWEHLLALNLKIPVGVEKELVPSIPTGSSDARLDPGKELSLSDQNNVAKCMELSAEQWIDLVKWGTGAGKLERLQLGVASTLASYAAQGWARTPSSKQAKHGAAIIQAARSAGIL